MQCAGLTRGQPGGTGKGRLKDVSQGTQKNAPPRASRSVELIVPNLLWANIALGDPHIEFHAAITRTDLEGYSGEGWHPEQAVNEAEAVRMFTEWAAYAAFEEEPLDER